MVVAAGALVASLWPAEDDTAAWIEEAVAPSSTNNPGRTAIVIGQTSGDPIFAGELLARNYTYFETKLPIRFRFRVIRDMAEYQQRVIAGEFDIMSLSSREFVRLEKLAKLVPFVTPFNGETIMYRGAIFTSDSTIRTIEDLRGKRLTFVNEQSASGYLYPLALMLQKGIDPYQKCAVFEPSGSHNNVILNVLQGKYDAGFANALIPQAILSADQSSLLTKVAVTSPIPSWVLVFSKAFVDREPILSDNLKRAFLEMDTTQRAPTWEIYRYAPFDSGSYNEARKLFTIMERRNRLFE